ncbi:YciI family protein [Aeromicrobium endophyticum]|nr:YciI family protein [Aeromicrobium endophyticum]
MVQYAYSVGGEERQYVRPKHAGYLASLEESGALVLSGPYADGMGAVFLYRAVDREACESLVRADPFWQGGFVDEWSVREFLVGFGLPDETDRVVVPEGFVFEYPET